MSKDFKSETYIVDESLVDTLQWLTQHQDCFDSLHFDVLKQELLVCHANGEDVIKKGQYLNASYGILITSL
ncbi:hypothetical protein QR665_11700 [Acinetobacter gerneri]|uniref:hypothetical protein n=1 Tax=Acinetobacter gerneri TaxID=202952 RepID=UPI002935D9FA|nr:hypothetical protein [Acinetobacter gerneri]MDV2440129.1 hypothetical protein [Acinetobacter gerneri]